MIFRRRAERSIVRSDISSMARSPVQEARGTKRRRRRRTIEDLPLYKAVVRIPMDLWQFAPMDMNSPSCSSANCDFLPRFDSECEVPKCEMVRTLRHLSYIYTAVHPKLADIALMIGSSKREN